MLANWQTCQRSKPSGTYQSDASHIGSEYLWSWSEIKFSSKMVGQNKAQDLKGSHNFGLFINLKW